MTPELAPLPAASSRSSEYDYRVLFLSGGWRMPGQCFRLQATVYIRADGSADGAIHWQSVELYGRKRVHFATEKVSGSILGREVALDGYEAEPPLCTDTYRIRLDGGEEGTFGGVSRTFCNDWSGSMEGQFAFRNRKA